MGKHWRRNRRKKQRKIIIVSVICLTFIMVSGYAAFSTTLNIGAKGNVKYYNGAMKLRELCNTTSGDGLYKDTYEDGRCIYRGSNPNNFIKFNNELWRIIAVEKDDTLKIIRNDVFENEMVFDNSTDRINENNTYCSECDERSCNFGCNAWSAVSGVFTNGNNSGTVTQDSSLNIYLNNEYYNSIVDRDLIAQHSFYYGGLTWGSAYKALITEEKEHTWNGKIGLINISDFYKASTSSSCNENVNDHGGEYDTGAKCGLDNYLRCGKQYWSLSSNKVNSRYVIPITSDGFLGSASSSVQVIYVRPVLFINSDIKLKGDGTADSPYLIK